MKEPDLKRKIVEILSRELVVAPGEVVSTARLREDLGVDSLDVVELTVAFEEEFGIEIPDDAAARVATVGDIEEFMEKELK